MIKLTKIKTAEKTETWTFKDFDQDGSVTEETLELTYNGMRRHADELAQWESCKSLVVSDVSGNDVLMKTGFFS